MYDNDGDVIQAGTTTFYTYDYQNRLTQSNIGNGNATTTTTYAYGPFGERISQTTGNTTTVYTATAVTFLNELVKAVPYKIDVVLTDNGIQFADLPKNRKGPTAMLRGHPFDRACRRHGSNIA